MSNIDTAKEREKRAKLKDLICSCGVGYGSLEDHPDWCLASDLIGTIRHLRNVIDAKDAEISRLEVKCDRMGKWIDSLRMAVGARDLEIEGLREALKVFADSADGRRRKDMMGSVCFGQDHLLKARSALRNTEDSHE